VYGPRNSEYDYDDDEEENDNNRVLEPDIVKSATIRIKRSNSIGYSL
jgi:hypothetical protein